MKSNLSVRLLFNKKWSSDCIFISKQQNSHIHNIFLRGNLIYSIYSDCQRERLCNDENLFLEKSKCEEKGVLVAKGVY